MVKEMGIQSVAVGNEGAVVFDVPLVSFLTALAKAWITPSFSNSSGTKSVRR